MRYGKLGSAALIASSDNTVYTVPSAAFSTVNINVVNTSSTLTAKVRIAITEQAIAELKDYIEYDTVLTGNGVLERTGLICGANEKVVVMSDIEGVVVRINGLEEDV